MKMLLSALLLLQAAPLDDFYKFKPDTSWTYKRLEEGSERKISARVTSDEGGSVRLDWKEFDKDGTAKDASIVTWSVKDGLLTVEARKEGDAGGLSFAVLKEGAKKDDKWASPGGEVVHLGKADVTVPAGTYKDAIWTQFKAGDNETKIDFYLVPKVGLVKIEINPGGAEPKRFELTEFKDSKK